MAPPKFYSVNALLNWPNFGNLYDRVMADPNMPKNSNFMFSLRPEIDYNIIIDGKNRELVIGVHEHEREGVITLELSWDGWSNKETISVTQTDMTVTLSSRSTGVEVVKTTSKPKLLPLTFEQHCQAVHEHLLAYEQVSAQPEFGNCDAFEEPIRVSAGEFFTTLLLSDMSKEAIVPYCDYNVAYYYKRKTAPGCVIVPCYDDDQLWIPAFNSSFEMPKLAKISSDIWGS